MLEIKRFIFGPFQTNCYVVIDEQQILLIDPACSNGYERQELSTYIEKLRANNQRSIAVLATHGHLDHLWGAKWAYEQWETPVLMDEADMPMAEAMQQQYDLFGVRMTAEPFPIEPITSHLSSFTFQLLSTPGHTPGSVCFYFPEDKVLFSGDTLFQMGYGRTDLPGGNYRQLIDSLEHLFTLPSNAMVYPGHGDFTTIGAEKGY